MGMGHSDFVMWSFSNGLERFNLHLRWDGWEQEVAILDLDQGISVYPFPFTAEGKDLAKVLRRPAPIAELLLIWEHVAEPVKGMPDGGIVTLPSEY